MKILGLRVAMMALTILAGIFQVATVAGRQAGPVYRTQTTLVEVYATVFDQKGRYISGLTQDQFEILDDGAPCQVASFEPATSGFSCAVLLDLTGSMLPSLPVLKSAVLRFIDAFREEDIFAVYAFNTTLRVLQDFTQEKKAAKRAVLRTMAQGGTALLDSLSEVANQLATRKGKKVIVVFTDGADNSSYLDASAVIRSAKNLGIPIYAVAQGDAVHNPDLLKMLRELSRATGGSAHEVNRSSAVDEVFQDISRDLQHSYMLAYAPPEPKEARWRSIRVKVKGLIGSRIRAREGYFPR